MLDTANSTEIYQRLQANPIDAETKALIDDALRGENHLFLSIDFDPGYSTLRQKFSMKVDADGSKDPFKINRRWKAHHDVLNVASEQVLIDIISYIGANFDDETRARVCTSINRELCPMDLFMCSDERDIFGLVSNYELNSDRYIAEGSLIEGDLDELTLSILSYPRLLVIGEGALKGSLSIQDHFMKVHKIQQSVCSNETEATNARIQSAKASGNIVALVAVPVLNQLDQPERKIAWSHTAPADALQLVAE